MYLYSKLQNLKKPIRVAFIGCGKFVSMFLAQYNQLNKIILDSIIELDMERAKKNCLNSGLSSETIQKINFADNLDKVLDREMLGTKVKEVLNYVPAAVFPAIIFPGVFFNDFGLFVAISDPKIYGAIVALVVGFYSRSVIATIVSGLLSYWFIIFFLLR